MGRVPAEEKNNPPEGNNAGEARPEDQGPPSEMESADAAATTGGATQANAVEESGPSLSEILDSGQVHSVVVEALQEAQQKASEAEDRMLRAVAAAQNERKRLAKEQAERIRFANESLLSEVLPVLDNLQLCVAHAGDSADLTGLRTGVEMTLTQFKQVMQNVGAKEIEVEIGTPFEPKLHEALMQDDDADLPARTVTKVLQAGFTYHDRVLRPVRVAVSTGKGHQATDGVGATTKAVQ